MYGRRAVYRKLITKVSQDQRERGPGMSWAQKGGFGLGAVGAAAGAGAMHWARPGLGNMKYLRRAGGIVGGLGFGALGAMAGFTRDVSEASKYARQQQRNGR